MTGSVQPYTVVTGDMIVGALNDLVRRALTDAALARLAESDDLDPAELDNAVPELAPGAEPEPEADTATPEEAVTLEDNERPVPLALLRRQAVLGMLREWVRGPSPTSAAAKGR